MSKEAQAINPFIVIEELKRIIQSDPDFVKRPFGNGSLPWVTAAYYGAEEALSLLHPKHLKLGDEIKERRIRITPTKGDTTAPNQALHFIWLGGPLPEKYQDNIKGFQKIAAKSGYTVNLWMEDGKSPPPFPEDANIQIRRISELQAHKAAEHADAGTSFDRALAMEIRLKNWGNASDILRIEILRQVGGVYLDTDHIPKQKNQPGNSESKQSELKQPDTFPSFDQLVVERSKVYLHDGKKIIDGEIKPGIGRWSNDILAAYAGNIHLTEYLSWILGNYNEYFSLIDAANPEVCSSLIYLKNDAQRGKPDFFALTIFATGFYTVLKPPMDHYIVGFIPTTAVPFDPVHLDPAHRTDLSYAKPLKNTKLIDALDLAGKVNASESKDASTSLAQEMTSSALHKHRALELAGTEPPFDTAGFSKRWVERLSLRKKPQEDREI